LSLIVDIKKSFPNFQLEVAFEAGNECLGLLGASGCGKSVTMRCIAGLEHPDEGKIIVNGETFYDSAAKIDLSPQKRKTALLFQNYMLFPNITVGENILAGVPKKLPAPEREEILRTQLKRFKIEGYENRYPYHLSGGQQQRVALARMLAAKPGLLMLDEPFSALDSHLKSVLEQELLDLFERFDGTVLYVSHDIDEAFRFCDRIAVMHSGHICEVGPTNQIVDHPTSLATVRISGCKNACPAHKVGPHIVHADEWDIDLVAQDEVPDDVKYVGVREFLIHHAEPGDQNVMKVRVRRVSDSRYERSVMIEPIGISLENPMQWKIDKLGIGAHKLPEAGDVLEVSLPTNLYLVNS
jgi:molybdate transport system ATP-binding protein